MHHIQRKILAKLMHANALGYAKMRPAGIESNHFAYHLEQLLHEGLVVKNGHNYSFTPKGLALTDRASHEHMTIRLQPQIVTSIHVTNGQGQLLLYKHAFQPYMDLYGAPQGRLHYEEHVGQAAVRELTEKTGLSQIPLRHKGMAYVHATRQGQSISKLLVHVFSGVVQCVPPLAEPTEQGSCMWADTPPADEQCMPGYIPIRELLQKKTEGLFFAEIETEMR